MESIGISQSRTSQHLGLLKAHHLVLATRQGRQVYYSLRNTALPDWVLGGFAYLDTGTTHGLPLESSIAALRDRYR